ncbi:MAG TPA: DNA circularization N-terminal domain-containing protein, partial [Prosthecobacter sp.]|nr:DNA circularization N-terminal domain-containing protein [Prosthecobacter sp.]
MSYRDRYKPASFRGVPFFVKMAEMPFGRRSETHEYPQRDEPYTEDLGRQAREFTVSAYICIGPTFGDDYITARDRLIDAIEKDGSAGTLILPTHAPQQVVPKPCRVRYDGDNGGVEYLELVFTEAGKNAFPNASGVDTAGVVNSRADDAVEAIKQIFGEAFTVEDLPAFVSDDAQTIASDLVTALRDAAGSRVPITDDFADYTDSVDTFEGDIATVVTDPDDFADQVTTLVAGILDIYEDPRDAYTAYVDLYSFGDDLAEINPTTTTRQQQKDNREGL